MAILSPGTRIGGKYEVVEVIGFGGMGVVYKVREQVGAVSRIRALKTVLPQHADDPEIVARFRQEAEKMCMLEHENIVPVLSYSEEGQFPYLIMPFIEGQTLKEHLAAHVTEHGRPLPLHDVMQIGLEITRGLQVAHGFVDPQTGRPSPMVHRDIKPGNVMVRVEDHGGERRLRILIMDFGIAKVVSGQDSGHSLTGVIGTVRYASPEQIRRGRDIDPRADIYSLGMVLFELYCGRHMFADMTEYSVLLRLAQHEVEENLPDFPEGTPEAFRELIRRSVAVDRNRRFGSVSEMQAIMRRILDEDSGRRAIEARRAEEHVEQARTAALGRDAAALVPSLVADAESLLEQARRSEDPSLGIRLFHTAALAFERAAEAAAREQERRRLSDGVAGLEPLRAAALRAEAPKRAPAETAAAERAGKEAERALAAGEVTAASRAFAEAERAWREAETRAVREARREQSSGAAGALRERIVAERSRIERLPDGFRPEAAVAALAEASAAAAAAEAAIAKESFDEALVRVGDGESGARRAVTHLDAAERRLREEVDGMAARATARLAEIEASGKAAIATDAERKARASLQSAQKSRGAGATAETHARLRDALSDIERLAETIERRIAEKHAAEREAERKAQETRERAERERLSAEHDRLCRTAEASVSAIEALGSEIVESAETRRIVAALAEARRQASSGDLCASNEALGRLLPDLERHLESSRALVERQRAREEALAGRESAQTALVNTRRLGDRATTDPAYGSATARIREANGRLEAEEFAPATEAFAAAARELEDLGRRIEKAETAERLASLRSRTERLGSRLAPVPATWTTRRRRKAALAELRRSEAALAAGDERGAAAALQKGEAIADELAREATVVVRPERRPTPRWVWGAGGGALAAIAVAAFVFVSREEPEVVTREPKQEPTAVPAEREPTAAIAAAPPPKEEPLPEPTSAPTFAPTAAATAAPTVAPKPQPTAVPPIALASVQPSASALRIPFRGEQTFEARVEGDDSTSVSWELDGRVVGRGERFRLNEATRPKPGRHRLELVATRGRERKVLRSWQIEVAPEALRFAALQPTERALEETVGGTVSFRAPIESDAPDELSWAWEVNGRRAEGARGPSYEFAARDPGRYDVKVRALASSGASIDNTWTLTVSRPAMPTPAVRVNAEAELLGWIDAYCRAFEQRDTDALLALGHLGSRSEAERLRQALSAMRDLELSCTNPSVRVDGDQATVSFDRTDRWKDPRGQAMERSLPRITKDLRRANGRWVATP